MNNTTMMRKRRILARTTQPQAHSDAAPPGKVVMIKYLILLFMIDSYNNYNNW
jgi:hypothetical protein